MHFMKHYNVSSAYSLGIRIRSLPLVTQVRWIFHSSTLFTINLELPFKYFVNKMSWSLQLSTLNMLKGVYCQFSTLNMLNGIYCQLIIIQK